MQKSLQQQIQLQAEQYTQSYPVVTCECRVYRFAYGQKPFLTVPAKARGFMMAYDRRSSVFRSIAQG